MSDDHQIVRYGSGGSYAAYSPDERHRYVLYWPIPAPLWKPGAHIGDFVVVGLNPSTATETKLDPTLTRCRDFAIREGAGALRMLNLFSVRGTDPDILYEPGVLCDESTDAYFRRLGEHSKIVLAWGGHGRNFVERVGTVLDLLSGHDLWCFGLTKTGQPKHPLYLAADTPLVRWPPP